MLYFMNPIQKRGMPFLRNSYSCSSENQPYNLFYLRLFHMLDPPLDKKRREEIATLLQICSDDKASDNFAEVMIHSKTYTVDHLLPAEDESSTNEKEKDEVKGKTEEGSYSSDSNCTIDEWTLSTGRLRC